MNILNRKTKTKKKKNNWLIKIRIDFLKGDKKFLMVLKTKCFQIKGKRVRILTKKDYQYHLHK